MDCDATLLRFWAYVGLPTATDCLPWQGHVGPMGYGTFAVQRRNGTWGPRYAHRVAYSLMVGPIPEGLTIDHLCKNRSCVYVGHMELVTRGENTLRGNTFQARYKAQTACKNGHAYTPATMRVDMHRNPNGTVTPTRRCLVCMRINGREAHRLRTGFYERHPVAAAHSKEDPQ